MDIHQLRSWIFELYEPLENERQYIVYDEQRGNLLIDAPPFSERALRLVRPGGLIAFDNMLWGGAVADTAVVDPETSALRALNAKIHDDARVDMALATIGDGVMMARVR